MDETIRSIREVLDRLKLLQVSLHREDKERRRVELNGMMSLPDFWNDRVQAQKIAQEASDLEKWLTFWDEMQKKAGDLLAVAESDKDDLTVSLKADIEQELAKIKDDLAHKELEILMSGEYDAAPAILTIYSGAGGVDAQDWAQMLERMYLRFAELMGWKTAMLHRAPGQEAGIKSATIRIEGMHAYGYLKAESGVHRLVRLSPYDADHARHTSFAMVEVLPELDEIHDIEVPEDDVRIDVYRSSGHGGQSVNTTDSAVRLTHTPTGIMVVCQNERSQMQNKAQAWKMLLGKLQRYYESQLEEERQQLRGEFTENAWGSQIRSYVLHPYKLVKDHRTKFERKDPDAVLGGDIMPFIEAELTKQASNK